VVGRASAQSYQGIDLTIQMLGQRKKADLLCVVVHSLAYANESDRAGKLEEQAFLARSFRAFDQHIYQRYWPDSRPVPTEQDQGAAHYPQVLRYHTELERFQAIDQNVAQALFLRDYQALCARIEALCMPSGTP
jgi:hypothetical protein